MGSLKSRQKGRCSIRSSQVLVKSKYHEDRARNDWLTILNVGSQGGYDKLTFQHLTSPGVWKWVTLPQMAIKCHQVIEKNMEQWYQWWWTHGFSGFSMASNGFQRVKAMGFTGNSTVTSAQGLRFLAEDICAVGLQASLASLDAAVAAGSVPSKLLNETPGPGGPGGGGWCWLVMVPSSNVIYIIIYVYVYLLLMIAYWFINPSTIIYIYIYVHHKSLSTWS